VRILDARFSILDAGYFEEKVNYQSYKDLDIYKKAHKLGASFIHQFILSSKNMHYRIEYGC